MICFVLPSQIDEYWGSIEPLLNKSVKRCSSHIGINDVLLDLRNGRSTAWLVIDNNKAKAVIVTTVHQYPRKKSLRVDHIGGSGMSAWLGDVLGALKEYAAHVGAEEIEAEGRKGFDRICGRYGFSPRHTTYGMNL